MIRRATLADVASIMTLLMRVKVRTVYATTRISKERALKTLRQLISGPQCYAKVAVLDGKVIGVLLGIKEPIWFSPELEAKDITFACEEPLLSCALADDFCTWAFADARVCAVLLAQSSGVAVDRTTTWLERKEFERVGSVMRLGRWDWKEREAA
jgi:hypothetical protein